MAQVPITRDAVAEHVRDLRVVVSEDGVGTLGHREISSLAKGIRSEPSLARGVSPGNPAVRRAAWEEMSDAIMDAIRLPGEPRHADTLTKAALTLGNTGTNEDTQPVYMPPPATERSAGDVFGISAALDAARKPRRHPLTGRIVSPNPVNALHGSPTMQSANGLFRYAPGTQAGTA